MTIYQYSKWDGTKSTFDMDEDDLIEQLSDDILEYGDLRSALRELFQRGLWAGDDDQQVQGLRDLLRQLRNQRQQRLDQQGIGELMDDIKELIADVVDTERKGIDRRLLEAKLRMQEAGEEDSDIQDAMRLLEERARKSLERLDELPDSPASAIRQLTDHDFIDPDAQNKFRDLLDFLQQQMTANYVDNMRRQIQGMSDGQQAETKNMLRALNQMLRDHESGLRPDFDGFMERFGHHFDLNQPATFDELLERLQEQISATQSMMNSMTDEMREELDSLIQNTLDGDTMREMAELASHMQPLVPQDEVAKMLQLVGIDSTPLDQAMKLMDQVGGMDDIEAQIRAAIESGDLDDIDLDDVEKHLGDEARRQIEQLHNVVRQLEEAGYIKGNGDQLDLTPRGMRKLGQQALREVFKLLKKDRVGQHEMTTRGDGGEPTFETKPYEFGDPFDVDLHRTLFNAVLRNGPGIPVSITPDDLEVRRSEHMTQAATVLLIDQSRSMGTMGSFAAAKKVALALYWLIRSKFPRDRLHMVAFSDYAIEIKGDDIPTMMWNTWGSGTNMHHAFMRARQILAKERAGTKQVLMITDGEPTAHLEGDQAYFNYPPSYRTIDLTLKEVKRLTRQGITINTFMLETNPYLMHFVDRMTAINHGRAFYTTPNQLGEYVMVDYLRGSRKRLG
jgi:uncharacterized protein with von Willebrand factor type A (vWA) domain